MADDRWRQLLVWSNGQPDLAPSRARLPADDQHAARLMADMVWSGQLHQVPGDKLWYVCADDLSYHRPDASSAIDRRVEQFAGLLDQALEACRQQLAIETRLANPAATDAEITVMVRQAWAGTQANPSPWKPLVAYATGLRKATGLKNIRTWLTAVCGTDPEVMADHHPRLLNMANCTAVLDRFEGEPDWYQHDPSRLHTYRVEAAYLGLPDGVSGWDVMALCPRYRDMLWWAAGCDEEVFWYLVMVLGYAALGANPLHLLYFLSGPPRSGKTKLLEILSTVLGERLAYEAKPDLIASEQPHSRNEASMRGARVITISETNERLQLSEVQLKRLTGMSHVSVSMLWDKTMTRVPVTWLFIIDNNQMPKINYMDTGLAARTWVLPMGKTIPAEHRDPYLAGKIVEAERDGIATMLVWACREAMRNGGRALMMPPLAVVQATETYRREQDTIGLWLAERTNASLNGHTRAVAGAEVYDDYLAWCKTKDEQPLGRNTFYTDLAARSGISKTGDAHHVWFIGFELAWS